jgi:hypothetical protein
LKLWTKRWLAALASWTLFCGCGKPVPLLEERTLNPFEYGCTCLDLSDAQLVHFLLVGDKRLDYFNQQREECIKNGLLEDLK